MATPTSASAVNLESLCGSAGAQNEMEASISALIESMHITTPTTPEVISRVLDSFLQERGDSFDFGRGFDMKSTLTSVISEFFLSVEEDTDIKSDYPEHERVALVLWLFDVLFPPIQSMNDFAAKISSLPNITIEVEVDEPGHTSSVMSYQSAFNERAFERLSLSWKRQMAFSRCVDPSSKVYKPDSALECVVAQLLAGEIVQAYESVFYAEQTISDVSEYGRLGIAYHKVKDVRDFHLLFKLLRKDLDALCSEDFDQFWRKNSVIPMSPRDQRYWKCQYWNEESTGTLRSEVNVRHGFADLIPLDKRLQFWMDKRLAIWSKLSRSFRRLVEQNENSAQVAYSLGNGVAFYASMGIPGRFNAIEYSIFLYLTQAFENIIPELRMINEAILSNIAIPGLGIDSHGKPIETTENLKEGVESFRAFYDRLVKGQLKSTDLTEYSERIYLDVGPARAAFDKRLDKDAASSMSQHPDSNPRKRTRASASQAELADGNGSTSNPRKKPSHVKVEQE